MLISWIIAPLLFYVILTQSNTLKQLKWLIFYYSFWGLFLTTFIGLFKPVFITPAVAGIQIGILRNYGNFTSTFIMTAFLVAICCTSMIGLATTLAYRYLMVFPSILKELFTLKKAVFGIFLTTTISYILSAAVVTKIHQVPIDIAYQWGRENYDKILEPFFNEKTFFIAPFYAIEILFKITAFLMYFGYFVALSVLIFLRFQMSKYKSLLKASVNQNILFSGIIQGFISVVFLLSPYAFIFTVFSFKIPNTASFSVLALGILSSHCFIDFLTTLFFITPYRKFLLKPFNLKISANTTVIAPAATITRIK